VTALLKLTLIFAGIVVLLGRKWNLGLVLLLASASTGLLFGYPILDVARDAFMTTVDLLTLRLALVVVMIMVLGELLRQTAALEGMVAALQALIPNGRVVIAALPALVGLLPMVGGAMLSAPMVNEVGDRLGVDSENKTFVNYWFRHIWEPIFPTYPSVLVATALLDLTTIQLMRATWPIALAAVTGGLLFGLLGLPRRGAHEPDPPPRAQSLRTLAASIWPVALVIALSLTLPIDERFSLIVGLAVTITLMMVGKHVPLRDMGEILHERIPWKMVALIFGALIFRRVLENSGAVLAVSDELTALHIPLALLAFGVPFIGSLLTGLIFAGFSIGFPVILPLLVADGGTIAPGWTAWLLAAGFLGAMFSPVHMCLALTRAYFKAEWGPIYLRIAPSALLVTATAATMLLLA